MKLITVGKKIFRVILMLFFRFDWWHTSPLDNRQYACDVIIALEKHAERGAVLELGCGLGDIIGKIKYKEKYFLDVSSSVLRAAKFLQQFSFKRTLNFYEVFDFVTDTLDEKIRLDAIILVNWIHAYESQVLREKLSKLIKANLKNGGLVVFDVIENNPSYKFNHSISDLINVDLFDIKISEGYKFGRKLVYATLK